MRCVTQIFAKILGEVLLNFRENEHAKTPLHE